MTYSIILQGKSLFRFDVFFGSFEKICILGFQPQEEQHFRVPFAQRSSRGYPVFFHHFHRRNTSLKVRGQRMANGLQTGIECYVWKHC